MKMKMPKQTCCFLILAVLAFLVMSCGDDNRIDDGSATTSDSVDTSAEEQQDLGETNLDPENDPAFNVDLTPLPIDDQLSRGRLDNGLSYYLRSNDSPGSQLELRLVVKAGARNDPNGAEGVAHYLEHMLFNGTEKYPGNELLEALRDLGIQVGPDVNASTSQDSTVYRLVLLDAQLYETSQAETADETADDPPTYTASAEVEQLFDILGQFMSAASLNPEDVEAELGIIRDEYRFAAEFSSSQVARSINELYASGTPYEGKHTIGTLESIESMDSATLREFYNTWYQPSNMAVVAVGDIPVSLLEQLVRDHFGDLEDNSPTFSSSEAPNRSDTTEDTAVHGWTTAEIDEFTAEINPEPVIESLVIEESGPVRVSLDWRAPVWPAGTAGGEYQYLVENLIIRMLANRLYEEFNAGRLTVQISAPYLTQFFYANALRFFGMNFGGVDLTRGLTDIMSILEGAAEFGFTQQELDTAVEALRTTLNSAIRAEPTQQDYTYANSYTEHFIKGNFLGTPQERLDWFETQVEELAVADLSEHWQWFWTHAEPIIVPYGENELDVPNEEDIAKAVEAVQPRKKLPPEQPVDTLMTAPAPLQPVSSQVLDLFGNYSTYEWQFENGAKVIFTQSKIAENLVNVRATSLGGYFNTQPGEAGLSRVAVEAVAGSGLGDLSAWQLANYLEGSTAVVGPWVNSTTESMVGRSSSEDLEDLFALLHLYHTQPRVRQAGLSRAINNARERNVYARSNGLSATFFAHIEARNPGNPWYQLLPSEDQINNSTPESLLETYQSYFDGVDGDLIVMLVGDTDEATVADLAARYIATLPAGEVDTYIDRRSPHPDDVVRQEVHLANPAEAHVRINYDKLMEYTAKLVVTVDVLESLLGEQLFLRVREQLGDSYRVSAELVITPRLDTVVEPEFYVGSEFISSGGAESLQEIYDQIISVITEIADTGPTSSNFEQAKSVVADNYLLVSNEDLLGVLDLRRQLGDSELPTPSRKLLTLQSLTVEDVRALAADLYASGQRIEVFGLPA